MSIADLSSAANRPGGRLDALDRVETPALVIDLPVLRANLERAASIAREHHIALRPHIKTHKSIEIARLQLAAGAAGVTASKADEALVFIAAGVPSVTIAYPLVDIEKIGRLIRAAREHGTDLRLIADSREGIATLSVAAVAGGVTLPAYLKVDVGLHRCGVLPEAPGALDLAHALDRAPRLRFAGLLAHAGHAYGASSPEQVRAIARSERETLLAFAQRLHRDGIEVPEISVGSTPTVMLHDGFAGLAEARPGNYVFMDMTQVGLGVAGPEQIALSVLATVVSHNERYAIVDAGSKVLSSDRGPHGADRLSGYGAAVELGGGAEPLPVVRLSEEHGFIEHGGRRLAIGAKVRILPNHACPVANLADSYVVIDETGSRQSWPVDGRGRVR